MADITDLAFAGAARSADLLRAGMASPRELVEACLRRIHRPDPQLSAFRVVLEDRALVEADQAAARLRGGDDRPPLGVPVAVKDDVGVAGERLTLWNRIGNPAMSLPSGLSEEGRPLAVQPVSRPGSEKTLPALAAQLEEARPRAELRPAMAAAE